jgi:AcrR family transcriptional regulator
MFLNLVKFILPSEQSIGDRYERTALCRRREGGAVTPTALEAPRSRDSGGPLFRKLKPGPGHSAAEVLADQRVRLEGAMVELAGERGYPAVTVRGLSRWAGVSTRTFYKHFANVEVCFASTYESLMRCALGHATAGKTAGGSWEESLRAGLRSVMQDLGDNPAGGQLALIESFAMGPPLLDQRRSPIRKFEQLLVDTFAGAPDRIAVPVSLVQGMVAGAARVARTRLLAGRSAELPGIVDELVDWLLALRETGSTAPVVYRQAPDVGGRPGGRAERSFGTPLLGAVGDERGRILVAVAKLGVRDGYGALTVPRIRAEAGVSRRSFDAHFADVDACFLEAVEVLTATAAARAEGKAKTAGGWERGVHRASAALCGEIARNPVLAHLGFIEVFAPGLEGLHCRERFVTRCADRLRKNAPAGRRPSPLAAEASIAAAWRIVHAEIAAGRRRKLAPVASLVADVLLAPTLGAPRTRPLPQML